jgi:hypothetical protein
MYVIWKPQKWGGLGPNGDVVPHKQGRKGGVLDRWLGRLRHDLLVVNQLVLRVVFTAMLLWNQLRVMVVGLNV